MKRMIALLALGLIIVVGSVGSASANLIAHFTFEGNVEDVSGNALHGTVPVGSVDFVASTDRAIGGFDFGQALSLDSADGIGGFVEVPHSTLFDTESLTVMAWVNITHFGGDNPGWGGMDIIQRDGVFKFEEDGTSGNLAFVVEANPWHTYPWGDFPLIETGTWQHIAGTFDMATGTMNVFVDGGLVGTRTGPGGIALAVNANPLMIGCPGFWGIPASIALIDEVRIYDRALTLGEIKDVAVIPEPATMILLGIGLSGLAMKCKKKRAH